MDKKDWLNKVEALPNEVNLFLLKINFFPQLFLGKAYRNYKRMLKNQHYLSYDYTTSLINLVNHSIKKIPYYKSYTPINSLADFQQQIGFIDKEVVMANFNDFVDPEIDKTRYVEGTTGGTSGKPLRLLIPKNRHVFELATMHTMWETTGWKYHPRAVIRNHKLKPGEIYRINPITKEIIFDGFKISFEYFESIYQTLKKFNISFIHAYPSTSYEFALFLKEKKKDISFINAFLSGSENIYEYQTDLIEKQLGIRFYNWYGHSEKLILGGYCKDTQVYHLENTYGYAELIDENNQIISEVGKRGELVGTTLKNPGMPLIRYRTDDFAEYVGNYCPYCKRNVLLVKNIVGRWSGERIYNKDGSFVTTTALNLHSDLYNKINGIQYIQNEKGILKILIIKTDEYSIEDEQTLKAHFLKTLNKETILIIEYVDHLIKQNNGKFLHLISKVK
ncbi:MAG: phenylacetate--CoA ligase family protein [Salinivirgaceae bacterium]